MKKTIGCICLIGLVLFAGCTQNNNKAPVNLPLGNYQCKEGEEPIPAHVRLEENNRFQFGYSVLSSVIPMGEYRIEGTTLILTADNEEKDTYVFQIKDGTQLIFQKNQSAAIKLGDKEMIKDGATFSLVTQ